MSSFQINFPGSPQQFSTNANSAIKEKGGVFSGNQSAGTFRLNTAIGPVEGTYKVLEGGSTEVTPVAVTITKKPFVVPMSKIRQTIEGFF